MQHFDGSSNNDVRLYLTNAGLFFTYWRYAIEANMDLDNNRSRPVANDLRRNESLEQRNSARRGHPDHDRGRQGTDGNARTGAASAICL